MKTRWTTFHRLRKYRRKKLSSFRTRNPSLAKYLQLYWVYSCKLHGPLGDAW